MRLNGLGAPDETTLVPLNTVDAVVMDDKKDQQQRGHCFRCGKYGHYKAQCRRLQRERYSTAKITTKDSAQNEIPKPKCDTCGKTHKTENCWNGANAAIDFRRKKREFTIPTDKIGEQLVPTPSSQPKN